MKIVTLVSVALLASAAAAAATVTCPPGGGMYWESRHWEAGGGVTPNPVRPTDTTPDAYASFFHTALPDNHGSYCIRDDVASWSGITNSGLCPLGAKKNFGFLISFKFVAPTTGTYHFRFGADMGGGGFMRVDDTILEEHLELDLWYGGNWALEHEILSGSIDLEAGSVHHMAIYGYEACCDGAQTLQFAIDDGSYETVTCENLSTVPELPDVPLLPGGAFCDGEGDYCSSASVSSESTEVTLEWGAAGSCDI